MGERSEPMVFGIDVGGTKIAVGAMTGGELGETLQQPTDITSGDAVLDGIQAAAEEMTERVGRPAAIGIGMPSQIDFESGTVVASVNIPLAGVPVGAELQSRLGVPVYVDNDANCAALAEAEAAEDGPVTHLVMLTLGTGVGGGVVIDGRIYRGATGLGAELGHMVIDPDGPECPGPGCPNQGCLEAFCSGTALGRAATVAAHPWPDSPLGRIATESGKVTGPQVVELAREGDAHARQVVDRLGRLLGVGIANMVNAFEPQRIVVGGGLSREGDLFLDTAIAEAEWRALPALFERVSISLARGGNDAGMIGAGLLAEQERVGEGLDTATEGAR